MYELTRFRLDLLSHFYNGDYRALAVLEIFVEQGIRLHRVVFSEFRPLQMISFNGVGIDSGDRIANAGIVDLLRDDGMFAHLADLANEAGFDVDHGKHPNAKSIFACLLNASWLSVAIGDCISNKREPAWRFVGGDLLVIFIFAAKKDFIVAITIYVSLPFNEDWRILPQ